MRLPRSDFGILLGRYHRRRSLRRSRRTLLRSRVLLAVRRLWRQLRHRRRLLELGGCRVGGGNGNVWRCRFGLAFWGSILCIAYELDIGHGIILEFVDLF